nr:MAG TPA: hypothetical protein [Caudoviricetes sp.]DAZ46006.1 MAG TPA: hypothetical protein [Caudoviricetes sp.]
MILWCYITGMENNVINRNIGTMQSFKNAIRIKRSISL